MPRHFVIVGAGLGGLATALRLSHLGHRVTVLEKTDQVGGRNRRTTVGDCTFDAGPTLLMMLDPFRRLFADVGERLEDHLHIVPCEPNYRVAFPDGTTIDCTNDKEFMAQEIRRISGDKDANAFGPFMERLKQMHDECIPAFVCRNYNSPLDLANLKSFRLAIKHRMLGNLSKEVSKSFESPYLRQLFCLQTMYLGLSPFNAPFVYGLLVDTEYREGIWYPMGGMVEIGRTVAQLAQRKGAAIRLNSPVKEVQTGSVTLETGETIQCDAVICNADLPYTETELLGRQPKNSRRYSCSAFMLYMDYDGELPELQHHNILMGRDFAQNLEQIFSAREIPDDPAIYVAISGKTDPSQCPRGKSNLYCLVPCPNLDHPFQPADAQILQERAFEKLKQHTSFDPNLIRAMKTFSPVDWNQELHLDRGAAFGLSHDLMQSVCFRPSNVDKKMPGVFYVGASTTPGNGLPMVLIGAELVVDRLKTGGYLQN